jgi:hypothetical protein
MTKKRNEGPLTGKFFHSVKKDGHSVIVWQGQFLDLVAPDVYRVQLHEWLGGFESDQVLVPVADMAYWMIYECAEDMIRYYDTYSARFRRRSA